MMKRLPDDEFKEVTKRLLEEDRKLLKRMAEAAYDPYNDFGRAAERFLNTPEGAYLVALRISQLKMTM